MPLEPGIIEDFHGKVGHEKRFHQTHFRMNGHKLRSTRPSRFVWIEVGVGRWKLVEKGESK